MARPVLLLGAGASIDAGLSDTNKLTRDIYKLLATERQTLPAQVFGYVIAKILTRKVRQGGLPFDEVNVEEAYDGLERLIYRDQDIASEFVSSWDPFLESLRSPFSSERFVSHLEHAVSLSTRHSLSGTPSLSIDRGQLRAAADEVANASASSVVWEKANILGHLIRALLKCLEHDEAKTEYMTELMNLVDRDNAIVASLNYDLLVEDVLRKTGRTYDYGISSWNDKKFVSFRNSRANTRLLKLHGSMNWFGNDDMIVVDPEHTGNAAPLMVFGGATGKLRPDGPFLQLRHEFERELLSTSVFLVVGYAFGDAHLNAIIRRWVSTRRKAKMIVINPAPIKFNNEMIGYPFRLNKEHRLEAKLVDITHIRKKTAAAIDHLKAELDRPIELSVPSNLSQFEPIKVIT